MRNYPKIIKNLNISDDMNRLADHLDRNSFILKGTVDLENDLVTYSYSNSTNSSLNNIEHNAFEFLPAREKKQLFELERALDRDLVPEMKSRRPILGVDLALIPISFTLLQSPFIGCLFTVMTTREIGNYQKMASLKRLVDLDCWFASHQTEVNERLKDGTKLYGKLSSKGKDIITIGDGIRGRLSLNNIEEFPLSDLSLVKKTIAKEEEDERKKRIKVFKKIRGM